MALFVESDVRERAQKDVQKSFYKTASQIIIESASKFSRFKSYDVLRVDDSYELISQIVDYASTYFTSNKIAEFGNNIYETAADYFEDDITDCGIFNELYNVWVERLFLLAIKKIESKQDEEYIIELLKFQDKTIEDYKNLDYIVAHKFVSNHKDDIAKSTHCRCLYCLKVFEPKEISEWISNEKTALCPYCSIDSVVGDASFKIDDALADKIKRYWF